MPPALVLVYGRLRAKNDFCDVRTPIRKSGGRQPAVRVGKTFALTRARLFGGPPTVYVRIAVAFALIVTTGADAPRFCIAARTLVGEKRFLRRANAQSQERRASARRGVGKTFALTRARLFGGPPTVYVRIAVAFALIVTTGADAPRSCIGVRTSAAKNDFCDVRTPIRKSERASARRGSTDRTLCRENRVLFANDATDEHKRHAFIVGRRSPLPVRLS
jgi:hypothetical protein